MIDPHHQNKKETGRKGEKIGPTMQQPSKQPAKLGFFYAWDTNIQHQ